MTDCRRDPKASEAASESMHEDQEALDAELRKARGSRLYLRRNLRVPFQFAVPVSRVSYPPRASISDRNTRLTMGIEENRESGMTMEQLRRDDRWKEKRKMCMGGGACLHTQPRLPPLASPVSTGSPSIMPVPCVAWSLLDDAFINSTLDALHGF